MRLLSLPTLVAGLVLAGCAKPEPETATVKGAVTFQGVPLAGGVVVFAPDREKGNSGPAVTATVGADGWYYLTADGAERVAAGWYRVALAEPATWPREEGGWPRFPAALRRPDRSGLDREIVAGRENVFHFAVEVPAGS